MKKVMIIIGILVIIAGGFVVWFGMPQGPSLAEVSYLKTPRIARLPSTKVLMVTAKGSPNTTAPKAFGLLMSAYFKLKDVPKSGPNFKAPRTRWPVSDQVPESEWVGYYAMPVPNTVTELTGVLEKDGLKAELATWEYGEVAEILHVGPYNAEKPTVKALMEFIEKNGYTVAGEHEEEYLKGPGMFFSGNPENYLTIIRYPVKKNIPAIK